MDYTAVDPSLMDAIIKGLSELVESHRRLADEFGLNHARLFGDIYPYVQGRQIDEVIREWLNQSPVDQHPIQLLFQHLQQHQLALVHSLSYRWSLK